MKKIITVFLSIILFGFLICFYYPRNVSFSLAQSILLHEDCIINTGETFIYFRDLNKMHYFFTDRHDWRCSKDIKINIDFNVFDFDKYDYLVFYRKKPYALSYSPYLTKIRDDLHYDSRIPLIPKFEKIEYDSIFIYKIKKSPKFRAPGP